MSIGDGARRSRSRADLRTDRTRGFAQFTEHARPALVNGAVGIVAAEPGRLYSVVGFTVRAGKIAEIDILADPARLRKLDLRSLDR